MPDAAELLRLSNRSERAHARKLARLRGLEPTVALAEVLAAAAGVSGLESLLSQRRLLRAAEAQAAETRREVRSRHVRQIRAGRMAVNTAWMGWFDGSAHPNPGRCGLGVRLTGPDEACIELALDGGHGSSSDAEYRALIALLEAALAQGVTALTVFGDSRVVLDDVLAAEGEHAAVLSGHRSQALALMAQIPEVVLRWIPRHRNGAADQLSQSARLGQAGQRTCCGCGPVG